MFAGEQRRVVIRYISVGGVRMGRSTQQAPAAHARPALSLQEPLVSIAS